jgi:hypothetical protein
VAEDGKTTTQLRAHVRRLAKELDDMKSVVSLLAMAPDRALATNWASELEKNGFAHHSAEEVKKALSVGFFSTTVELLLTEEQESLGPTPALPDADSFGTSSSSEPFPGHAHPLAASSYGGSSRGERYVCFRTRPEEMADKFPKQRTKPVLDGIFPRQSSRRDCDRECIPTKPRGCGECPE